MCEMQCPVFDRGAIEVYRFGENRRASGLYASDFQKRRIDALRKTSGQSVNTGQNSFPGSSDNHNDISPGIQHAPGTTKGLQ